MAEGAVIPVAWELPSEPSIPPERVPIDGDWAMQVKHLLSEDECRKLIELSEEVGLEPLCERVRSYRTNDRLLVEMGESFQEALFSRIKPFLPDVIDLGNFPPPNKLKGALPKLSGEFAVSGLNPLFRICRYDCGGFFKPHVDGCRIVTMHERSFYTVNIYLNGDFKGGTTDFLESIYRDPADRKVIQQIVPETGLGLLFLHEIPHEGRVLESNCNKYLLRTDVMYRRKNSEEAEKSMSREQKGWELYQLASSQEEQGQLLLASETYGRAFKLCPDLYKL